MSVKEAFSPTKTTCSDEKPVLDADLSLCPEKDRPRMIALINRLAKSEQGMDALTVAVKNGYRFTFMAEDKKANGSTNFFSKRVTLNPFRSDDKLIGTLCHECRHAGQNARSSVLRFEGSWDIRSNLLYNRAMEADAQACALAACKELELRGDKRPYAEFKEKYPEIESTFAKAYEKDGRITDNAMTEAFKGWYDQERIKTLYEQGYILRPLANDLEWIKKGLDGKPFDRSVSAQLTVGEITQTKTGNYFTDDPEILNGGKYMAVAEDTMEQMKNYVAARKQATGGKDDCSAILKGIPTRPTYVVPDMIQIASPVGKQALPPAMKRKIAAAKSR